MSVEPVCMYITSNATLHHIVTAFAAAPRLKSCFELSSRMLRMYNYSEVQILLQCAARLAVLRAANTSVSA